MKNVMVVAVAIVMFWANGCSSCDRGLSVYAGQKDFSANIQPCFVIPVGAPKIVRISGQMNPETKEAVEKALESRGWLISKGNTPFQLRLQRVRRGYLIKYIANLYEGNYKRTSAEGEAMDWSKNFSTSGRYMSNKAQIDRADAEKKAAVQAVTGLKD